MNFNLRTAPPEYIGTAEFENLYSLSRRLLFLWIKKGRLTAYKPSKKKTLVRRADVERLLDASKAGISVQASSGHTGEVTA
jgi:hypothetical protein